MNNELNENVESLIQLENYKDDFKINKSFKQVKTFINSLSNNITNIDIYASIALLRRSELSERGMNIIKGNYSYYGCSFADFVFHYVDYTFDSEIIVSRMQEIEAIVRCLEALKREESKDEIYRKYIGYFNEQDSIDNLYFCSRLNLRQKEFICSELDYIIKDIDCTFTLKLSNDIPNQKSYKY